MLKNLFKNFWNNLNKFFFEVIDSMNINSENNLGSVYYSDDEFLEDNIYSDDEIYFHN